jgi:hypothetical protein
MSPALYDAVSQLYIVSVQLRMLADAIDAGSAPNTQNIRAKAQELHRLSEEKLGRWGVFQCAECGYVEPLPLCAQCKAEAGGA